MDKRALSIQIARLLNESNLFKSGFTVIGESIYCMPIDPDGTERSFEIDPALWLSDIKAVRYEDSKP